MLCERITESSANMLSTASSLEELPRTVIAAISSPAETVESCTKTLANQDSGRTNNIPHHANHTIAQYAGIQLHPLSANITQASANTSIIIAMTLLLHVGNDNHD